ncbi:endospore germination permease [Paenibacillus hodogayensis]|uniref:Endospore germination permease n=1 Tax=Paenibacillus hodogayensis TaxID=279208 RepID=A0ABV5VQQ7_9BACL
MNRGQISVWQMALLLFQMVLGSSILLMPSITTRLSGRDMWMTPIVVIGVGYLAVWLAWRLHRLSPDGTFHTLLENVFGKMVGKTLGLLFIVFQLHILSFVVRDYGEFIVLNFFFKTPVVVVIGMMLALCVWALRAGIEVLARIGQLFVPLITFITILIFALLIPELDPGKVMPLLERGFEPVFKGSLVVGGWFCQLFLMVYLLPNVKDSRTALKWGMWAATGIGAVMLVTNLALLMLLGESTSHYVYPVYTAARYIAIADFFEHVESMIMMVWVLGEFIKIGIHLYAVSIGLAQCLQLKKTDALIVPLGLLLLLFSFRLVPGFQTLAVFVSTTGTIYILTGYLLFPLFVYAGTRVRKAMGGRVRLGD